MNETQIVEASKNWNEHNLDAAKSFISNVVFIDDRPVIPKSKREIIVSPAIKDTIEDEVFGVDAEIAEAVPSGEGHVPATQAESLEQVDAKAVAENAPGEVDDPLQRNDQLGTNDNELNEHDLPVRPLTSALAAEGVTSSFFFPDASDEEEAIVLQAERLALQADVVVLDWHLRNSKPDLTIEVIKRILRKDAEQKGRLRLICIYTGELIQTGIAGIIMSEVREVLELDALTENVLAANHVRIAIFNKSEVPPEVLPLSLLMEFAELTKGLMSSFALNAISVLRNKTKQLLKVFSSDLDSAIVSHRLHLTDSDDVEAFGLDVLLFQIKSLLSTSMVHRKCLSSEKFKLWVDAEVSESRKWDVEGLAVDKNLAKELVDNSFERAVSDAAGKLDAVGLSTWKSRVQELPFAGQEEMARSSRELARLSKLIREKSGFAELPEDWKPTLGLGSVVKYVPENGGAAYFFCAQPLCDSVRLTENTVFPLLKLSQKPVPKKGADGLPEFIEDASAYWIVVKDGEVDLTLQLKPVPKQGKYIKFKVSKTEKRVLGEKTEDGEYEFSTTGDKGCFYWLADVEPLQAQRALNSMAAMASRVGVDEYEVLRRGMPGI
ncbi:response regulator receiver domain [Kordiimonas lacus]|uniref:Response receiver domain-containing protein n=1 Tax=Kordiimonas lacus TaxID=637679 RepID=A0A1G6U5J1_9PROT|nr:response regulator receiver domain [Kordiimonas lacus]SDD36551.1 hypothetical protein SAMN04488071_0477 [Kordiimonas lacus]